MDEASDDLTARLAQLEARVTELEARQAPGGGGTAGPEAPALAPPPVDPEVFWALHGLRSRAGEDGAVLLTGTVPTGPAGPVEWQEAFPTAALLEADWALNADAVAALGHPIRLVLLREVLRGVRTAADLAAVEDLGTTGQLYHHLRQLVAAGWLRTAGRGRYEVPAAKVVPLLVIVGSTQP